jgi:hypothetical protein
VARWLAILSRRWESLAALLPEPASGKEPPPAEDRLERPVRMAVVAIAVFVGTYWYMVNAYEFYNPFYPIPVGRGGKVKATPGVGQTVTFPMPREMLRNMRDIFGPRLLQTGKPIDYNLGGSNGWGWTATLLGIPALAWVLLRRPGWRLPASCFAVSVCATLMLVEHDVWNARFVMWLPALFACGLGVCVLEAPQQDGWRMMGMLWGAAVLILATWWHLKFGRGSLAGAAIVVLPAMALGVVAAAKAREALAAVALIGCCVNLAVLPWVYPSWESVRVVAGTPWYNRDSWLVMFQGPFPEEVQRCLESPDKVVCITHNVPTYALARGDFRRPIEHAVMNKPEDILKLMDERGCRYLFAVNIYPSIMEGIMTAVRHEQLRPVGKLALGWFERARPK